jgi:methionine-rich copper-binding protein CopC
MQRPGWTLAAIAALALSGAGPASAAYAPQLSFSLNPATAKTPAAITSTVTQAAGETPSKTVTVTLPPGFTANTGNQLSPCTAIQQATGPCPAASQMGQASTTVDVFGMPRMLSGPVYFGGPADTPGSFRLIVALVDPALGPQTLTGVSSLRGDGSIDTVFDNLPNFLATAFTLALDGGPRALLDTPAACGTLPVKGTFVSQAGEQATATAPITVTGCSATTAPSGAAPAPAAPSRPVAPLRVGAARLTRSGVVTFALSTPAKVTVTVTRAGKRVARRSVAGRTGTNRVRLGRRLKAGRYAVSLRAASAAGKVVTRRTTVRLR